MESASIHPMPLPGQNTFYDLRWLTPPANIFTALPGPYEFGREVNSYGFRCSRGLKALNYTKLTAGWV